MADVVIFEEGKTPRYLKSVNTPDYADDSNVLVNPDMSDVEGVDPKFWKMGVDRVEKMTPAEMNQVIEFEQTRKDERLARLEQIEVVHLAKALVRAGVISKADLVTALKGVLNG